MGRIEVNSLNEFFISKSGDDNLIAAGFFGNTARYLQTNERFNSAGAVGAIEEVNKWTPFLVDLYRGTTPRKVAEFQRLQKAEFDANNFPVPPKPERIQRMKRDLTTYNFHSQSDFQRVQ